MLLVSASLMHKKYFGHIDHLHPVFLASTVYFLSCGHPSTLVFTPGTTSPLSHWVYHLPTDDLFELLFLAQEWF